MTNPVSTTTALHKIDANRPVASQVIDGDTIAVTLDLEPIAAGLLNDIAQALRTRGHLFTILANNRVGSHEHTAIREQILTILKAGTALQVTLGADQAEALATDLWEATTEPNWCACAENYATRPDGNCDSCGATADVADASYGQLRAV